MEQQSFKWDKYEQEFRAWLDNEIDRLEQKLDALKKIRRKLQNDHS